MAPEDPEPSALAIVGQRARDPPAVREQPEHRALHVHVDPLMNPVVLQRPDHLQSGAVADVREPRILVPTEVALEDPAVLGAIEERAPGLELPHPVRRFLRVQLGHAPVVDVLSAAHGVGEVDLPAVPVVHVGQRRGDAAFRHHRVGLAEERLADQPHLDAGTGRGDRRAEAGAARADHQHVVSNVW